MATPTDILQFWFGSDPDASMSDSTFSDLWWSKNDETDERIKEEFGSVVQDAAAGALEAWKQTPEGRLALIILLDQFPRNIYRNSPRAFAYDPIALELALEGLDLGHHLRLRPIQRVFWFLPLEHSESLDHQNTCVDLFAELADTVPGDMRDAMNGYLDYAKQHRDVIKQFGRFHHRNAILDRDSTPEEVDYLSQPGAGF